MTARPGLALLATAVVAVGGLGAAATATAAPAGPPSPAVSFFDGPASPEDLVTLPGTDTVLASGLAAGLPAGFSPLRAFPSAPSRAS